MTIERGGRYVRFSFAGDGRGCRGAAAAARLARLIGPAVGRRCVLGRWPLELTETARETRLPGVSAPAGGLASVAAELLAQGYGAGEQGLCVLVLLRKPQGADLVDESAKLATGGSGVAVLQASRGSIQLRLESPCLVLVQDALVDQPLNNRSESLDLVLRRTVGRRCQ
jgi:hypothetical protein